MKDSFVCVCSKTRVNEIKTAVSQLQLSTNNSGVVVDWISSRIKMIKMTVKATASDGNETSAKAARLAKLLPYFEKVAHRVH